MASGRMNLLTTANAGVTCGMTPVFARTRAKRVERSGAPPSLLPHRCFAPHRPNDDAASITAHTPKLSVGWINGQLRDARPAPMTFVRIASPRLFVDDASWMRRPTAQVAAVIFSFGEKAVVDV